MNKELSTIVTKIRKVAKELDKAPSQVTKADLVKNTDVTDWTLRKYGSLSGIISSHFPLEKKLDVIQENKHTTAYINKLEKQLGDKILFENQVKESVSKLIKPLSPIKLINHKKKTTKTQREIVVMLNDTHYGLLVDKEEVNDLNSYGWLEASRRTAMVIAEAIDFKPHTRNQVEKCHLVLNGDIIAGLIHGTNTRGLDLFVHQMNGAIHILVNAISKLAMHFKEVQVSAICGNHCDALHKREGGNRVVSEKFDSYSNVVFFALSTALASNKRVSFHIPKTPYGFVDLPGGRMMFAHGDTVFSKSLGNPGTSINVKGLGEEIRKFNAGEIARGKQPIKLILFGHTHAHAEFITPEGVKVYCAPSLSGLDGYAHSLNINNNFIGQVVFESTTKYIMGDSRLVQLNSADTNKELDKIIPTFKQELKWKNK